MYKICYVILFIAGYFLLSLLSGCRQALPVIDTSPVTRITATTAECGGIIKFGGKPEFTSYGICWDTKTNPTIANLRTVQTITISGQFEHIVRGLTANTTYFARAYATNPAGTAYGEEVSFTTTIAAPVIITSFVSDITSNSALSGSIILFNGGSQIQNYGICWDTFPNPTIKASKTIDSLRTTVFLGHIEGLKPNRLYYVRPFATNSAGTGYGEEKTFTTIKTIPYLMTSIVTEISLNSAICGLGIISDGGTDIMECGICWSTDPDPITGNSKTTDYYTPGKLRMTGLRAATNYYVRAYAINSSGTGYGTSISFRTLGNPPVATTLDAVNLSAKGAVLKAIINANYFSSEISFEYGRTSDYGVSVAPPLSPVTGIEDKLVTAEISGLETGTTYHFRVKATNSIGTTYGKDMILVTLRIPSLSDFPPMNKNYNDTVFIIKPPASNSPGTFTYSSSNKKVAVVQNDMVKITGSGTCTITATQAPAGIFTSGTIKAALTMNLTDIDGNVYNTVAIGSQDWMKENLGVTRYSDGTPIPNEPDNKAWNSLTNGAYCLYNNDVANLKNANGALYNWYAVASTHKLCPSGWHVPTDSEWKTMEIFLGMTVLQAEGTVRRSPGKASAIKNTEGWIKNGKGTNKADFSALASGFRSSLTGIFTNMGFDGCWWTATEDKADQAWLRNMYFALNDIFRISDNKNFGFSVRCVRDK
jgi:uncharacterized protein (TIGR02145 family)